MVLNCWTFINIIFWPLISSISSKSVKVPIRLPELGRRVQLALGDIGSLTTATGGVEVDMLDISASMPGCKVLYVALNLPSEFVTPI